MKVPFSWLKQYVDIDVSAQELETKLFDCGFEVEELIDLGAEISKVVVGVVTECVPQEGTTCISVRWTAATMAMIFRSPPVRPMCTPVCTPRCSGRLHAARRHQDQGKALDGH